jgi:hypothetical protein
MTSLVKMPLWTRPFVLAVAVTGCSSMGGAGSTGTTGNTSGASAGSSELRFALTDAPGPFDQILVRITAIDVHQAGAAAAPAPSGAVGGGDTAQAPDGGDTDGTATADDDDGDAAGDTSGGTWSPIAALDQTIDLLTLQNGVTLDAGGAMVPAGAYDMVRLVVSSGSVVLGGQTYPLTIPSGAQSGVKLRYALDLSADMATTVTLDFDGAASVVETGKGAYLLKPVLSVKSRDDHARGDGGAASGKGGAH